MDTDFQDIAFLTSLITGVWEQVGASSKSANALWLDALGGAEITFNPDAIQTTTTSYIVVPDISHSARFFTDAIKGVYLETVELRFISKSRRIKPTDSVATGLAALRPHYQY